VATVRITPEATAQNHANGVARRVTVKGKRMVVLEEAEFDRLLQKADEWEPLLPEPDADGTYPAVEALRVSLAQKIIRDRRRLGLTQADLARKAGIRPESLNRIEQDKVSPSIPTLEKIDRALRAMDAK
jgi:HTH-type transcriptional regulator / antitoxin HipB